MKKKQRFNPRKVLAASAGVASISYLSTTGCATDDPLIANLVASPGGYPGSYTNGNGGSSPVLPGGSGGSPLIANLVAPPPGGTANEPLDASPDGTPGSAPDGSPDDGGLDSGFDSGSDSSTG